MAVSAVAQFKQQIELLGQRSQTLNTMNDAQKTDFCNNVKNVQANVKAHLDAKWKSESPDPTQDLGWKKTDDSKAIAFREAQQEIISLLPHLKFFKAMGESAQLADLNSRVKAVISLDLDSKKSGIKELSDIARNYLNEKWEQKKGDSCNSIDWRTSNDLSASKFREKHKGFVDMSAFLDDFSSCLNNPPIRLNVLNYNTCVSLEVTVPGNATLGDLKAAAQKAFEMPIQTLHYNSETTESKRLTQIFKEQGGIYCAYFLS